MVNTRKALQRLYKGKCTIIEQVNEKDPVTKITKAIDKKVVENEPCKVSYNRQSNTSDSDAASEKSQFPTLSLSPDIVVKAGSKIIVTQNGRTQTYTNSGEPAVYESHQRINLMLKDYA